MRLQSTGLTITLALHALAALGLLSYAPAREALLAPAPIMVALVAPGVDTHPEPPAERPKPKPVTKTARRADTSLPQPVISAPPEAPARAEAPANSPPAPVATKEPESVTPPVFNADYFDNPAPPYPPLARRMSEQGRVTLRVLVNAAGAADDVQVRESSGFVRLDEAARDTVRRWKFIPAKRGTEPVPAWVLIPISFRLEG